MRRFTFRNILLMVLAVALISLVSCSKDSTGNSIVPDLSEQQIQETAAAVEYALIYLESTTSAASAATAATGGGNFEKGFLPVDTLYTGCPTATYNVLQKLLTIDYGEGCTGPSGIQHSGSIVMTGSLSGGTLQFTATFNNFTTANCTIGGGMVYRMTIDTIEVTITNGTVSCGDSTVTLNANLKLAVNLNGTPGDPLDDTYMLLGSGTVMFPDSASYSFNITSPLVFYAGCSYPTSGVVEISGPAYTAAVDFYPENGDCDDIAEISVGPLTQKVHLSLLY